MKTRFTQIFYTFLVISIYLNNSLGMDLTLFANQKEQTCKTCISLDVDKVTASYFSLPRFGYSSNVPDTLSFEFQSKSGDTLYAVHEKLTSPLSPVGFLKPKTGSEYQYYQFQSAHQNIEYLKLKSAILSMIALNKPVTMIINTATSEILSLKIHLAKPLP